MNTNKRPRENESDEESGEKILAKFKELISKLSFDHVRLLAEVLFQQYHFDYLYIKRVVEELKRFLILKVISYDLNDILLSPSAKVDHAWCVLLQLPQVSYLYLTLFIIIYFIIIEGF